MAKQEKPNYLNTDTLKHGAVNLQGDGSSQINSNLKHQSAGNFVRQELKALRQPLLAIVLGLFVGMIFITLIGKNPFDVYSVMFQQSFFKPYYLVQTLTRATPIIICGLATAIAWRAGYINIGVEGQMIAGTFAATVLAIYSPIGGFFGMILAISVGMLVGALYASIVSFVNLKFKASIVICSLMLNYVANYVASYYVNYPFRDLSGNGVSPMTVPIPLDMHFLILWEKTTLNFGIIIAILAVLALLFMSKYMVFGYESKMTGLNPNFARYGGVLQNKVMLKTMALSGAVAALAGICEIFGFKYRYLDGMFTSSSYAWTGLMAALIANLHPVGIFFTSIFLAGLQVGGQAIQRSSKINIPVQMSTVIQSVITLFVSVKFGLDFIKKRGFFANLAANRNADVSEVTTSGQITADLAAQALGGEKATTAEPKAWQTSEDKAEPETWQSTKQ